MDAFKVCLLKIRFIFQAGANMIVSGSAVVKSDKPKEVIDSLRATTEKWIKINFEASQWPFS